MQKIAAEPLPLRVLIVEDDADARASLCDILSLHAHQVSTADSVEAALGRESGIREAEVIILDRKLPEGMAEELLPRFRELAPQADLIVVTGYADLDASLKALRQGVTDYLIKPINPDALLATLSRIAHNRKVERELARQREFAELVLQTSEAVIAVLDMDGRVDRINRRLAEITGGDQAEVVGLDWVDTLIAPGKREAARKLFQTRLSQEPVAGVMLAIRGLQERQHEVRFSSTVLRDEHGQASQVLLVGVDVTDLIHAQQKLVQSERLAAIGQTMTGLAHESRNALQRLRNAVELLEDDLAGDPDALRYVEKISRAGNDLRDLLEEVRAYAAPIALDVTPVPIPTVWRRAWESLEHRYRQVEARLVESGPTAELPPVSVDPRRMEQVFRNLFENALDACGTGVEIRIEAEATDEALLIRVGDNGPGLSPADAAKIFDAFFTTKPTGTGLGLAIVYRIVESHRGTIQVTSSEAGAQFEIRLPLQPVLE